MDHIDTAILGELEINSNRKFHQLAKILNIPRSTLHNRIKKLEKTGVIKTYKAILNYDKLDKTVTAFVNIVITSEQSAEEVADRIKHLPSVEEVHIVTGQFDLIAKVRFKNTQELGTFIFDKHAGLRSFDGVERTESMIVLNTKKEFALEM
jgi:DNA-binding Lrp family transcriptional regulator